MKSNYNYDDTVVRWGYIVDFYNTDKAMSIRMAPELTDRLGDRQVTIHKGVHCGRPCW